MNGKGIIDVKEKPSSDEIEAWLAKYEVREVLSKDDEEYNTNIILLNYH